MPSPAHRARAIRLGALAIGAVLGLSGCTFDKQLPKSVCIECESAWQDFVDVRESPSSTPRSTIEASREMRERWSQLLARDDLPDDVHEMISLADGSFVSAWNASTSAERNAYQRSWINGREYIALQCAGIGVELQFDGEGVPVEAPRDIPQ